MFDGLNLTKDEWEKCDKEIPLFFKENGEYRDIIETVTDRKGGKKEYSGYLMVSKAQVNEQLYEKLQWILQYYLETTFFVPKISFVEFESVFRDYMKESAKDYISNGYTDFLFSYFDSGSFSVTFDPKKYDIKYVCEKVENIWNDQETLLWLKEANEITDLSLDFHPQKPMAYPNAEWFYLEDETKERLKQKFVWNQ